MNQIYQVWLNFLKQMKIETLISELVIVSWS